MPSSPYSPSEMGLALLKPARKLALLAQHSPLAMVEWNSDLVIVGWNPAAATLFNFFEDEAIGQPLDQLLAQRQMTAIDREMWLSCDEIELAKAREGFLCSHVTVAGKKLCRWFNTPFWVSGQRVSTLSTIVEVAAAKTLNESEEQLKKLTANLPGIVYQFCLSADGKPFFPFVSSSCETLFELMPDQVQANAGFLIGLIHPADRADFERSIKVSAQLLSDWQWQGRFVLPSGRTIWIRGASRPERLADGSVLWDGLLMDITDSKQAEAALQASENQLRKQTEQLKSALQQLKQTQTKLIQSEKMSSLGQLVAGIAHEINNPVNFIHGNLTYAQGYIQDLLKIMRLYQAHYPAPIPAIQKISEELELDYVLSDLPKLLSSVQSGTERIRQIVVSLRNFSRLDESELKKTDVHEGLESTLMILSNRLKANDSRHAIEVVKAYEQLPLIECYVSQLNQVFMSILVNAIDAIDGASTPDKIYQIVLQTFSKGEHIVIRMTNNGPPISAVTRQQIFDPFFTTKPVGKGTGMGLAISYQTIVDLHKGILEYSQTEDQKTVFTIEIPLNPPI
jgi:signal transduction histidine kinase